MSWTRRIAFYPGGRKLTPPGGRIAVISSHSARNAGISDGVAFGFLSIADLSSRFSRMSESRRALSVWHVPPL